MPAGSDGGPLPGLRLCIVASPGRRASLSLSLEPLEGTNTQSPQPLDREQRSWGAEPVVLSATFSRKKACEQKFTTSKN